MQFDREKLVSVIAYVVSKCPADKLGAVKLNKVLYFSDMLRYAETGNAITGATYCKSPYGPTCKQLSQALSQAVSEDIIRIQIKNYFGYNKKELILLKSPDVSRLSGGEIALVDEIIEFVCDQHTAKTISDFSHNLAWESVELGGEIKYNSVYHIFPAEVSDDALEWAAFEVEQIEASRSSDKSVERKLFRHLRDRVLAAVQH